ncbi:hypothetical protein AA0113_g1689 [Alternaria arborescens]|uniref:Uncharacterized protein n=1 Tax=Alternaria arborescens TaxID=156630 RepID=A0A4V1X830_9PLEO|nr:hypothetical protein AA0113_g1689 [Alternaria arborescens]
MADRPEDDAKSKETSPPPTDNADLQTPINFHELHTPSFTSSSIFSLSNFTLTLEATDRRAASDTAPPTPTMDPVRYTRFDFEPCTPFPNYQRNFPNVHDNRQPETPEKSRTIRGIGITRAIEAGKRLKRFVGTAEPVPFVTPPAMPKVLEQEFVVGMKEYGLDHRVQSMGLDVLSQAASMQERLPEIRKEHEGPVKATWTSTQSGQQASGSSPPRMTSQGPAANSMSSNGSQPVRASYDTPSLAAFKKQMDAFEEKHVPAYSNANPNVSSDDIEASGSRHAYNYNTRSESLSSHKGISRIKPLFPSPRAGAQSWDESKSISQQHMVPCQPTPAASSSRDSACFENLFRQPPTSSVPYIVVPSPSPTKLALSQKHLIPQAADELFRPDVKDIHSDNKKATGLPTLPASSSALWEVDFPGYTPALLTILLTWSHAMQSFYRRLPDPKTFPIHAAFPRRITPPAYNRLISVGFYDTSFIPHKEIRFLGPGDMAEIGYAEVDVFRSKEEVVTFNAQAQEHPLKSQAMKRRLGTESKHGERKRTLGVYWDQIHLADSGEGRWAYVLIKEHAISEEETAPHVMLAWHLSAVTDTSTRLHTVFPDNHEPILSKPPATPAPPEQPLRGLASLQNLISPSRGQEHLHREICSVSSSAGSTEVEESSILPQEGAQTLKRTVVKLEKAGSIPLIEGYRVDLKEFRGWLDAVSKGEGKVIVWRESPPLTSLA